MMPSIGEQVLHYEIIAQLGQGGMGQVFKARDTRLDRDVALKFGLPNSQDKTLRDRLAIEAKAVARVDHPHIGVLYNIEEVHQDMFLCMALYEGSSLEDILAQGALKLEDALELAKQILQGLAHAHQQGVIHRDIKPANIFVTQDQHVKILDFGLARLAISNLTVKGDMMGTPKYISPEQLRGEAVDVRADIWSFAVLLFEMLTGALPFQGEFPQIMVSILKEDPASLAEFLPHPGLQEVIERCLAKTREDRYPSCDAILQALEALDSEHVQTAIPTVSHQLSQVQTPPAAQLRAKPASRRPQRLVGRADDIKNIVNMLEEGQPLVTLVGIGGAGKTSLARAAVSEFQAKTSFEDGHYFIALDALQDSRHIPQELLQGLGLEAMNQDPWDVCLSFLAEKTALIVLDNLEQFTDDAAALIEDLLTTCPNLSLLCTSREILNLADEVVYDLKGLSIPQTSEDDVMDFGATALFTTLVTRQQRNFNSALHKDSIIEICQLLDGWPLGIELAAAWVKHLALDALKEKLQTSLNFLRSRSRSHASRHQSAQAAFDSSWRLLSDVEQVALSSLAVFQGGFTLEAAEAVTQTSLELLACLMDKSLVTIHSQGRYDMHPLVWQLSREKLQEDAMGQDKLQQAHAHYFADFLAEQPHLDRVMETRGILDAVDADFANIRQAWMWAVYKQDEALLGKSVVTLGCFFRYEGRLSEGERLLQPAYDVLASNSIAHGKVICDLGILKGLLCEEIVESLMLLERSVEIFEVHQAKHELMWALLVFGIESNVGGNYTSAQKATDRCLALAEELGDKFIWAWASSNKAVYFNHAPYERIRILEESIAIMREMQTGFSLTWGLRNLAYILTHCKGDYQKAYDLLDEASMIERKRGWENRLAEQLIAQSDVCFRLGRIDEGHRLAEEALQLALAVEMGFRDHVIDKCYFKLGFVSEIKNDLQA
ncbi:MAG: protein kinase, partial [Deinococcota bacterium]